MKLSAKTLAAYAMLLLLLIGVAVVFISVNQNAQHQSMTSNDMKAVVQPAPDSGVKACSDIAERQEITGPKLALSYDEVQAKFEFSRAEDIKSAGTHLVETLKRVDAALADDNTDLSTSMGAVMALRIAWEDLQQACGSHGIDIPDLPA